MSASSVPKTSQTDLHPRLDEFVKRHLDSAWRQPVHEHTRRAFAAIAARMQEADSLILDSGCGTGLSTARLAECFPGSLVVGIDKSRARLARAPKLPDNAVLVRAELADFWRLCREHGVRLSRHFLLYPNPWPKPGHLARRWHGHPVFPDLLALGGRLEMRTNFELYAREMARALQLAGVRRVEVVSLDVVEAISPFERKYSDSGHPLFQLNVDLEEWNP